MPFPGRENQAPCLAAIAWRKRWSSGFLKSICRMLWSTYTTAVSTWTRSTPNPSNCIIAIVPVASCASVWSTRSPISVPGTSSPRTRCSSRIVRAREAIRLNYCGRGLLRPAVVGAGHARPASVPEQSPDPLVRREILPVAHRPDRPAVRERLVDGEIETAFVRLETRPVERALPVGCIDAAARGTLKGLPVGPVLEEKHLH